MNAAQRDLSRTGFCGAAGPNPIVQIRLVGLYEHRSTGQVNGFPIHIFAQPKAGRWKMRDDGVFQFIFKSLIQSKDIVARHWQHRGFDMIPVDTLPISAAP